MAKCITCGKNTAAYCVDCHYDARDELNKMRRENRFLRRHIHYLELKLEDNGVCFSTLEELDAALTVG